MLDVLSNMQYSGSTPVLTVSAEDFQIRPGVWINELHTEQVPIPTRSTFGWWKLIIAQPFIGAPIFHCLKLEDPDPFPREYSRVVSVFSGWNFDFYSAPSPHPIAFHQIDSLVTLGWHAEREMDWTPMNGSESSDASGYVWIPRTIANNVPWPYAWKMFSRIELGFRDYSRYPDLSKLNPDGTYPTSGYAQVSIAPDSRGRGHTACKGWTDISEKWMVRYDMPTVLESPYVYIIGYHARIHWCISGYEMRGFL